MKIFQFVTPDGYVDVKLDLLTTDLNDNATVMHVGFKVTNPSMINASNGNTTIANFLAVYPYLNILQLPTTGNVLKTIASTHNLTLNMYELSSAKNSDPGNSTTILYASTTTTTTSHS